MQKVPAKVDRDRRNQPIVIAERTCRHTRFRAGAFSVKCRRKRKREEGNEKNSAVITVKSRMR